MEAGAERPFASIAKMGTPRSGETGEEGQLKHVMEYQDQGQDKGAALHVGEVWERGSTASRSDCLRPHSARGSGRSFAGTPT